MGKTLRKFLVVSGIAVIAWGIVFLVIWIAPGRFDISGGVGAVLYITAFYLAPLIFLVGITGSTVRAVKILLGRRRDSIHHGR